MTIIYTILMIIGIIISLILITALFVAKKYSMVRTITINQPQQKVFDFIKYLKNQDSITVWANVDAQMKKEYRGIDGTVGFVSAWDSLNKKVGTGEQEIKKINEGVGIVSDLRFFKPFSGEAVAQLNTEVLSPNSTKVIWQFDSGMKYPMNFMLLFLNMEKLLGPDMEQGLANLKSKLEA